MKSIQLAILFFFLLVIPNSTKGYALLTHEAVIDASWKSSILPVLRKRFPNISEDSLEKAKAYVYGGAIMPDMGYFPMGSIFFTNLVHYTRGGDFTEALVAEAQNLNEYAFALGALAHYNADNYGHPIGINPSVPLVYPKDQEKFGNSIPYEQNPIDHKRMEFAFDVLQIARGNYNEDIYKHFIGFEISKPVLERAFLKTYGLELESVFTNVDLAIKAFRFTVKDIFPSLTKAAWKNKKDDILKLHPEMTDKEFRYRMKRKDYNSSWDKAPLRVTVIAGVIKVMPKWFGDARVLRFKMPTPEAEKQFDQSFDTVVKHYAESLHQVKDGQLVLSNLNYDTGHSCKSGDYDLSDDTYLELLKKLNRDEFANLTPDLKKNILEFYGQPMCSNQDCLIALIHH